MILTARQLEDLHKTQGGNGQLVLPYRARLTPLASDWVRSKKVTVGYSDDGFKKPAAGVTSGAEKASCGGACGCGGTCSTTTPPLAASHAGSPAAADDPAPAAVLWWCDGPCGPAKAALIAQAKESPLRPMDFPAEARQVVAVVKTLAKEIKAGRASAGVLVVQSAAAALVFANRCPSLRAVVGTCQEAVEQGIQLVAANVLVIEHPHRTLHQVKSMVARFARAKRELTDDVKRQLQELASCV